ncbi:TetR family transcriptional regulator [Paenarthrobacter sp. NPDC090520]|uniref:TetR family transcriptional regulator n=1 Tax=Paenarthrobacter sp. NPDC090520 TaxID=3364382 RepID=UPI003824865A
MARTAGRASSETQRLILEAAGLIFRTRGAQATLDDIARAARLSKGGLTYHFASKDDLIRAVISHKLEEFRLAVQAQKDLADTQPGSLTRAYVRASLCRVEGDEELQIREEASLMTQLMVIPHVVDLAQKYARAWNEDLLADGLPAGIVRLVVAAADGAGSSILWGAGLAPTARASLEQQLLGLTYPSLAWDHLNVLRA